MLPQPREARGHVGVPGDDRGFEIVPSCPDKKGGILIPLDRRVNADSKASLVETETCGVMTRYRRGQVERAQPLADPFPTAL